MAESENVPTPWWLFVKTHMDRHAMKASELARRARVDRSRVTAWKRGGKVSAESVHAVASALRANPLAALAAAGIVRHECVELREADLDPTRLTEEELLAELRRRMAACPRPDCSSC